MDLGPRPPPEIERLKSKIMEYIDLNKPNILEKFFVKKSQFSDKIVEFIVKDTHEYEILDALDENKLTAEIKELLEEAIEKAKANYEIE